MGDVAALREETRGGGYVPCLGSGVGGDREDAEVEPRPDLR